MSAHRMLRNTLAALPAALLSSAALAAPAAAQTGLTLSVGNALYSDDEFCLSSDALITSYQASVDGSVAGASLSFNNADWPWPPRGGSGGGGLGGGAARQANYASHGDAFAAVARLFPLGALARLRAAEGLARVDRVLRPFIGFGIQRSTDGEFEASRGPQGLPVYGVRGQTNPLLTFGASVLLPARDTPLGLVVTYRHNLLFSGDFELDTGTAEDIVVPGENLDWGEISVGFRFRLGQ